MSRIGYILTVCFLGAACLSRAAVPENDMAEIKTLSNLCTQYTKQLDFDRVIVCAHRIEAISKHTGDEHSTSVAYAFIGQAYMALNRQDSALVYINKGLDIAENIDSELDSGWTLTVLYNALGVYSLSVNMDYRQALSWFHKGIELCEKYNDRKAYVKIAGNLVRTYFLRNDSSGLPYAEQIYEYGRTNNDEWIMFDGAYLCALMHYLRKEYKWSEEYIAMALDNYSADYKPAEVYILYANVLAALGDDTGARKYYRLSMHDIADTDFTTATNIYLSYGRYLISSRQYSEAVRYLDSGLELSRRENISVYRYLIYKSLSEAYSALSDPGKALGYFVRYHTESDSIFNVERESSINELRIKYETEKVENELRENRIVVMRHEKNLRALIYILVIMGVVSGAIYLLYRSKNRLYGRIVSQNQEYVQKEKRLEQRLRELQQSADVKNSPTGKYSFSSLSEEKSKTLFSGLEELMNERHVYRENFLTKERVAEMLNSNRTYLSQVIGEHTGLSFNHYINSYRIEEAKRILSDPENDVVLKMLSSDLGFNSITTFYKVFQNEVGMPPSKFREKVIELSKR